LCMAHCLLLPLVLGALPAVMARTLEEAPTHLAVVALAAVLGMASFVPGFRQHRDWRVLVLGAAGLGLLVLAQVAVHEGAAEMAVTMMGGATLVVAHGLNRRRCRTAAPRRLGRAAEPPLAIHRGPPAPARQPSAIPSAPAPSPRS
ncbi:MAG: MerC domain-containing protein, partial [Archangium sp.]